MGYSGWTAFGEGFAMRLDAGLEEGKTYSFTFTYARDSQSENEEAPDFSPIFYTDRTYPIMDRAVRVGRLPATVDWRTSTITFTAKRTQDKHDWIILRAVESSGIVLSNCVVNDAIEKDFLQADTTLCQGQSITLHAVENDGYSYLWNTGATTSSIVVTQPGWYEVNIENYHCDDSDSVRVDFTDCEVRLIMPNIFSPNGDAFNPLFAPMEINYIDSGTVKVFDRWGGHLFTGDMVQGWDGKTHDAPASTGVYYYTINYVDMNGKWYAKRGAFTLVR